MELLLQRCGASVGYMLRYTVVDYSGRPYKERLFAKSSRLPQNNLKVDGSHKTALTSHSSYFCLRPPVAI
jgi:hypothetical protein